MLFVQDEATGPKHIYFDHIFNVYGGIGSVVFDLPGSLILWQIRWFTSCCEDKSGGTSAVRVEEGICI